MFPQVYKYSASIVKIESYNNASLNMIQRCGGNIEFVIKPTTTGANIGMRFDHNAFGFGIFGIPLVSVDHRFWLSAKKSTPRFQCFWRPDPNARRNTDGQAHEIFENKNAKFRSRRGGWSDGAANCRTCWLANGNGFPTRTIVLLVEIASQNNCGWNGVKNGKYANASHQFFQFLNTWHTVLTLKWMKNR